MVGGEVEQAGADAEPHWRMLAIRGGLVVLRDLASDRLAVADALPSQPYLDPPGLRVLALERPVALGARAVLPTADGDTVEVDVGVALHLAARYGLRLQPAPGTIWAEADDQD